MERTVGRRGFLVAAGAAALAGCQGSPGVGVGGGSTDEPSDEAEPTSRVTDARDDASGGDLPPTAEQALPLFETPEELADMAVSGGPGKDGIPSIDDPSFESADAAADRLDPGAPVFGVAAEAEAKAYPQSILVWHEICNDTIDDRPVSVTYCPLTGTAMGFPRGETTFGVSGRLINNNLIMYDRATETWWPQVLATAVPGPWNESPPTRSLAEFQVVWTTWERWRAEHPETVVLTRDTGHARNYESDPYGEYNPRQGYYAPKSSPMFRSLSEDNRYPPKAVVIGARGPEGAIAFRKESLRSAKLLQGDLDDVPHLAVHDPALDTGYVYRNPEERRFEHRDGSVVDPEGTSHDPSSLPLERLVAFDAMWFAWDGFYPDSYVYD